MPEKLYKFFLMEGNKGWGVPKIMGPPRLSIPVLK
jgi:hypothetical protein